MWMPLSSSGALGWEPGLRLRSHSSQGEPLQLKYPSGISGAADGNGARAFHISTLPTSLDVASFVILGYKISVKLVFIWLFRLTVLYFCCNSSWVLGGSKGNIHLLCPHLGSGPLVVPV